MARLTPKTSPTLARIMRRLALSYDTKARDGIHRIEPVWDNGAGPEWQMELKVAALAVGWQRVGSIFSVLEDALESPDGQEMLTFNNSTVYWSVKKTP